MTRFFVFLLALFFLMPLHAEARDISLSEIDATLAVIAPHARGYPPDFASDEQRREITGKLRNLLSLLDAASRGYPDDNELLFRVAFANAMGHILDIPGCDQRAIAAFERLLGREPGNRRANLYYGIFLSQTTLFAKSIPFLQRAVELGMPQAHKNLGFVYMAQRDAERALVEYKAYLAVDPDNTEVKKTISELERKGTSAFRTTTIRSSPGSSGGTVVP